MIGVFFVSSNSYHVYGKIGKWFKFVDYVKR